MKDLKMIFKFKRTKLRTKGIYECFPVPIISAGAISIHGINGGKLTPHLILDTSQRDDVRKMIEIQSRSPAGDVNSSWGKTSYLDKKIRLILEVKSPVELLLIIEFSDQNNIVIDNIVRASSIYIQSGEPGDTIISTQGHPAMLIEIPDGGFGSQWEKIYLESEARKLRKRGLSRKQAVSEATTLILKLREMAEIRI